MLAFHTYAATFRLKRSGGSVVGEAGGCSLSAIGSKPSGRRLGSPTVPASGPVELEPAGFKLPGNGEQLSPSPFPCGVTVGPLINSEPREPNSEASLTWATEGAFCFRVRFRVRVRGDYFLRLHTPFSIVRLAR